MTAGRLAASAPAATTNTVLYSSNVTTTASTILLAAERGGSAATYRVGLKDYTQVLTLDANTYKFERGNPVSNYKIQIAPGITRGNATPGLAVSSDDTAKKAKILDAYVATGTITNYVKVLTYSSVGTNVAGQTGTFQGGETLTGGTAAGLDGFNPLNDRYSFINFNIGRNIKFIQGDAVVYQPEGEALVGLDTGRTYFVDPVIPQPGQDITKIRIFNSTAQIGSASTVQVGPTTSTTDIHRFVLQRHSSRELEADKILRKIPLSQNLFVSSNQDIPTNDIGILINGVQIRSPISDNQIYYGPLESVDLLNGGDGYDVLNPPIVGIETSSGVGAAVEPILQGTVKEVFVDPQEFDIDAVQSISLTGGNGSGCVLQPILGTRNRELLFDSRDIFFNGGVDIVNETIDVAVVSTITEPKVPLIDVQGLLDKSSIVPDKLETLKLDESVSLC